MLFTSDMKAWLFERGRGAANNAAADSRAERMTCVRYAFRGFCTANLF